MFIFLSHPLHFFLLSSGSESDLLFNFSSSCVTAVDVPSALCDAHCSYLGRKEEEEEERMCKKLSSRMSKRLCAIFV